jgi:hypothetical protein
MERIEPINEAPENQLAKIADESGLAIIIVDERASISKVNNNSICAQLYSSKEFAPRCAQDCGRAFQRAMEAGKAIAYECHAGLDCLAVPLKTEKPLAAIVGRTFTKAENYRKATERAISGDWSKFPPTRFFENVLINGALKNLEAAAERVEGLGGEVLEAEIRRRGKEEKGFVEPQIADKPRSKDNGQTADRDEQQTTNAELTKRIEEFHHQSAVRIQTAAKKSVEDAEEIGAWRSLFGSLFDLSYREACLALIKFLARRYSLSSMAWLERRENRFESILATGTLEGQPFKINLPVNDKLLFDALEKEVSLDLRERARRDDGEERANPQTISLFPVAVGGGGAKRAGGCRWLKGRGAETPHREIL